MSDAGIPEVVRRAYGALDAAIEPLPGGLINRTYIARQPDGTRVVVQRLHRIFGPEVNLDLDAITAHLARAGLVTPRLVRTGDGAPWVSDDDGYTWRAITHIEGTTVHRVVDGACAHAAGALVGGFHRALAELDHEYAFARAGVHDTAAHLDKLGRALAMSGAGWQGTGPGGVMDAIEAGILDEARALGEGILAQAEGLPTLGDLPTRHCHGDLKISNILFAPGDTSAGRCVIDLDTLGRQTLAYELGDALRSWCNPAGEDVARAAVSEDILSAALAGYRSTVGGLLGADEWASIIPGLETVCVELAARFCADVFHDDYFGWDPSRFASRRAHNLRRDQGQLALARSIEGDRARLEALAGAG